MKNTMNDDRLLMIDGLKARIRQCQDSIATMQDRIVELQGATKAPPGRFPALKATGKGARPVNKNKGRKLSPAVRKRMSDGIRAYHAKKKAAANPEVQQVEAVLDARFQPQPGDEDVRPVPMGGIETDIASPENREIAFAHDPRD